ncbi:MAG: S-layer homology domain-containing protein [Bifidobacteriaceae bacterium]|jgi:hypothetical protein|nr:S-layer homology domain-containing protein [Bifidobacteriaceae bacterium]
MNNSKINLVNRYKDSFYSKNLFKKIVFCLIAVFCFSSFSAVSMPNASAVNLNTSNLSEVNSSEANSKAYDDFSVSITKIGANSVKINLQTPPDYDQESIAFRLCNTLSTSDINWTFKNAYRTSRIYSSITEYTFNNVATGNYRANVYSIGRSVGDVKRSSVDSVSIYVNAVNKPQFNDIGNQSADSQDQINWVASYGITTGYQDGGYHPNTKVSREQMASFIYRSAGKPSVSGIKNPFVDLANNEHKNAVLWVASREIVQGYDCTAKGKPYKACTKKGDKVFYGSKFITRLQLALEIYRYFSTPFFEPGEYYKYLDRITDSAKLTSFEEKEAVAYLLKDSIVSGYPDGEYKPSNTVSRAQMAKFMAYSSQDLKIVPFLKTESSNPVNFLNTGLGRRAVISIKFINYLPICSSPIDVSFGDTGAILACVDGDEITIGQIGGVLLDDYNTQYLFSNFNLGEGVSLDLTHLNANFAKSLNYMFYHFGKINNLIYPDTFGQTAKSMDYMFENSAFPSGFVFPAKFGQNCSSAEAMFSGDKLPADFSLPKFLLNQSNSEYDPPVYMGYLFNSAVFEPGFSLPDDFGMNVSDLIGIFANVNFPAGFHLPNNFAKNFSGYHLGVYLNYAFAYSRIPSSLVFPENFGSESIYEPKTSFRMDNMFKGAVFPENYSFPANFAERALVSYMFSEVNIPNGFILPDDFCSYCEGTGMFSETVIPADFRVPTFKLNYKSYSYMRDLTENMFYKATIASGWTLPVGFFQNAGSGNLIFNGAVFQGVFVLPNDFGLNYSIQSIFRNVNLSYNIDWSAADLTNRGSQFSNLFANVVWNNHVVLVKNEASKDALIEGGAPADSVQIKV